MRNSSCRNLTKKCNSNYQLHNLQTLHLWFSSISLSFLFLVYHSIFNSSTDKLLHMQWKIRSIRNFTQKRFVTFLKFYGSSTTKKRFFPEILWEKGAFFRWLIFLDNFVKRTVNVKPTHSIQPRKTPPLRLFVGTDFISKRKNHKCEKWRFQDGSWNWITSATQLFTTRLALQTSETFLLKNRTRLDRKENEGEWEIDR